MRSAIIILFFVLFALISIPLLLISYLLGKINTKYQTSLAFFVARIWAKVLLFLAGTKTKVIGIENIPNEPTLFVGNHISLFDIPLIYSQVPRVVGFVSKKEMKKVPIVRTWMKHLGCLFLDRDNIREGLKTILEGIEKIKSGHSMVIFPEGTRSTSTELLPFKEGSLKLAEKTDCPIVPVAITNSNNIIPKHGFNVKSAKVTIEFGKPIRLSELDKEDKKFSGNYVRNIIVSMLKQEVR